MPAVEKFLTVIWWSYYIHGWLVVVVCGVGWVGMSSLHSSQPKHSNPPTIPSLTSLPRPSAGRVEGVGGCEREEGIHVGLVVRGQGGLVGEEVVGELLSHYHSQLTPPSSFLTFNPPILLPT